MTEISLRVVEDVMESESFVGALDELISEESAERVVDLRAAIRAEQISRVHQIEGELALLEQLPAILRKHARQAVHYRP